MRIPRLTASLLALASVAGGLVATLAVGTATAPPAAAASAAGFDPGMIVSDATFYNAGTMDAAAIQTFLAGKYTGCASGYTCLRDLTVDTFDRPAATGLCSAYSGATAERASAVIAKVAQACGVNPQSLIVLMQKESGVVTSSTPNYRSATGYGCPDTAACDSRYYGFYNQVYMAAYQFKRYRLYPTNYGYVAGRTNYIQYNPNAACGGSTVYIQNQATAGLYDYTPYQPNAAALANFYGTGDSCSAYGNRNFYRYFTDWFGSTAAPQDIVVKTADSSTLFVVSGTNKYPIDSWATYLALPRSWQTISTVPTATVAAFTTGPAMGRLVRAADGTISFFDAGIRLRMPSCDMVADYGGDCGDPFPQLQDWQLAAFTTGPTMTSLYTTTSGRRYQIDDGQKREVLDDASLTAAGLSTASVVLLDSGIADLRLGSPVVRPQAVIADRASGTTYDVADGVVYTWSASTYGQTALATALPVAGRLDAASIVLLGRPVTLTAFARDAGSGSTALITGLGRSSYTPATFGVPPSTWPSPLLGALPVAPPIGTTVYARGASGAAVSVVSAGTGRVVPTWSALTAIAGDPSPYVYTLADDAAGAVPAGPPLLAPGTLAKGSGPDIWFVDGTGSKVHVSSLTITAQMGLTGWATVDDATLAAYPAARGDLSPAFGCPAGRYLGVGGGVRTVSASQATSYGLTFVSAAASTCYQLGQTAGSALTGPLFVRTVDDPTIYQLGDRTKRPVTSWTAFQRVVGTSAVGLQYLPSGALAAIPTGTPVS